MRRRRAGASAAVLLAALGLGPGCMSDDDVSEQPRVDRGAEQRAERSGPPDRPGPDRPPRTDRLKLSRCPPELSNCRTASGRIIYVERVDPDGDGDAHFVLVSDDDITAPGLSVIDVKKSLRPHPLPTRGDRISAAGPVYRGSYGQRQIEAIELHVARAR